MIPIETKDTNCICGSKQNEYEDLPAHRSEEGVVTTCWELSQEEIDCVVRNKKIYLQQLTFGKLLQPIKMTIDNPL